MTKPRVIPPCVASVGSMFGCHCSPLRAASGMTQGAWHDETLRHPIVRSIGGIHVWMPLLSAALRQRHDARCVA